MYTLLYYGVFPAFYAVPAKEPKTHTHTKPGAGQPAGQQVNATEAVGRCRACRLPSTLESSAQ